MRGAANLRTRLLALVLLAGIPTDLALAFGAPRWAAAFTLLLSTAALVALIRTLFPIAALSSAIRRAADAARVDVLPVGFGLRELLRIQDQVVERLETLQHRWNQRHRLTKLPTREHLLAEIGADLARGTCSGLLAAVRMSAYDRISAFDPLVADQAICSLAERLARGVGSRRSLAHVDRDCFAIWFGHEPVDEAAAEFGALVYALGHQIESDSLELVPDLELSTVRFPEDGESAEALLARCLALLAGPADKAKGSSSPLAARTAEKARGRFLFEQDLRQAISRNELRLLLQPVVDVRDRRVIGAEALLRWEHPERGTVSPAVFVPVMEDVGLIDEIGHWVLNTACREAASWREQGLTDLSMAVNLSARQLHDKNLGRVVANSIARHGIEPKMLLLELTESAAIADEDRTRAKFRALKELGVRIAIDDFGAGFSSLTVLKTLPFDKLKIDREFVSGIHESAANRAICKALVALSEGLEIQLLAEGVESFEEVNVLAQLGCREFQGFYFGTPLAPDDFLDRALAQNWLAPLLTPTEPLVTAA